MPLGNNQRVVTIVGYVAFFVTLFFFFLLVSFPIDRFSSLLESQISDALGRRVSIGDLSVSMTGGLVLSAVEVQVSSDEAQSVEEPPVPAGPGSEVAQKKAKTKLSYFIDEISIDIGFLPLLFDKLDLEVEMEAMGGEIGVEYEGPLPSKGDKRPLPVRPLRGAGEKTEESDVESDAAVPLALRVEVEALDLKKIYDLREMLPVPLSGLVGLEVDLESPTGNFDDAVGQITNLAQRCGPE